jgi:23S rRNA pseudouridine1911/1915/1917 synthase
MGSSTDEGWLPDFCNQGWVYRDRVEAPWPNAAAFYATRYPHSPLAVWQERLARGEIHRNGNPLGADAALMVGNRLEWHRPPWREGAVPATWKVVHDDGDLLVIDKPSGLPVLPAGGWLEHTVLRLLERRHQGDAAGVPRPVHRLGRFTSGLLVCARSPESRAWLSARLRESTAALDLTSSGGPRCRKVYQALLTPGGLPEGLAPGESLPIHMPIGRRPHPRLGRIWCAAQEPQAGDLAAHSTLRLLERSCEGDRVELTIASGRPHQIRIHCAAIGAPLLGDPLYLPGGETRAEALPGEGGYRLRAQRLAIERPDGSLWELDAEGMRPMRG